MEAAETVRRLEREDFRFPDLNPALGQATGAIGSAMPRRPRVLAIIVADGRGARPCADQSLSPTAEQDESRNQLK